MQRKNRIAIMVVGLALLLDAQAAQAQFVRSRRNIDADKPTRIYNVFDCQRDIIASVTGTAGHGRITTREARQNRCGNRTQRVMEVFYTPQPGFRGEDDVYLYWGSGAQSRIYLNVR